MKKILCLIPPLVLLGACTKEHKSLEIVETKVGVVLLNHKSGEIYGLDQSGLIALPVKQDLVNKASATTSVRRYTINQNIEHGSFSVVGLAKAIDNRLFYRFDLTALKDSDELFKWIDNPNRIGFIWIQLKDSDGFKVFDERINLKENASRILGESGKITGLKYEGDSYLDSSRLSDNLTINISFNINI